jgi:hypothetical protein
MDVHNFLSVDLFGPSNDCCLIQDADFVVCLTVLGDNQVPSCLVEIPGHTPCPGRADLIPEIPAWG